jgi:hypothetical protein
MNEGQQLLVRAAKHLLGRWKAAPLKHGDINDKLAADKLIWLVHNFDFDQIDLSIEGQYEVFEVPNGPIPEANVFDRGTGVVANSR